MSRLRDLPLAARLGALAAVPLLGLLVVLLVALHDLGNAESQLRDVAAASGVPASVAAEARAAAGDTTG
ncbi:hypothetical protein OFC41_31920, partial [Escherichia coli]|nr:hypothetical protein [Escherichia coli]